MKAIRLGAVSVAIALIGSTAASVAVPITLTGNYIEVGISDEGTFGSNDSTAPGILHDPTGTGNFAPGGIPNDYLTPGVPHDGFAVSADQFATARNDNYGSGDFGTASPTALAGAALLGYDFGATWSGVLGGFLNITNSYYFNANEQVVHIVTTITALSDLTGLMFARSTDPDPDVNAHGVYDTVNTRGDSSTAVIDLVSSAGAVSGLVLGILNESGNLYTHNTLIASDCCFTIDPVTVLAGGGPTFPTTNTGDFGLNMAWLIGDLTNGASATINYAYVFGDNQGTVGTPGVVPEPAAWALMILAFGALGEAMRRRRHGNARA